MVLLPQQEPLSRIPKKHFQDQWLGYREGYAGDTLVFCMGVKIQKRWGVACRSLVNASTGARTYAAGISLHASGFAS